MGQVYQMQSSLCNEAKPIIEVNHGVQALLDNWIYLASEGVFIKRDDANGQSYKVKLFDSMYSALYWNMPVNPRTKEKVLPSEFIGFMHKDTHKVSALNFVPNKDKVFFDDKLQFNVLNTWTRPEIKAIEGDVSRFKELVLMLCNYDENNALYLTKWIAHAIKYPEEKIYFSPLISSDVKGIGKNLLADHIIKELIGPTNYKLIESQKTILSDFDDWKFQCNFAVFDEVLQNGSHKFANEIKGLITGVTTRFNAKGKPESTIKNYINIMMFSNYKAAIQVTEGERRYFVIHCTQQRKTDEWYSEFHKWLDSGGIEAINFYLRNDVSLGDFNVKGCAIMTDDCKEIIALAKSDLGEWLSETVQSGSGIFADGHAFTKSYLKGLLRESKEFQQSDLKGAKFYHAMQDAKLNYVGKLQKPNKMQVDLFTFGAVKDVLFHYNKYRAEDKHQIWYDNFLWDGFSGCSQTNDKDGKDYIPCRKDPPPYKFEVHDDIDDSDIY